LKKEEILSEAEFVFCDYSAKNENPIKLAQYKNSTQILTLHLS